MNLPLRTEWEYHYPNLMSHLEMSKFSVMTLRNVPELIPCLDFCDSHDSISPSSKSRIVPLFEKVMSASDVSRIGRLVLPKSMC